MPVKKAIIPAAGLGTRFLPATKASPKEMLTIVDKPAIQYVTEEAVKAGLKSILIVTGRGKEAIENHFDVSYELERFLEEKGKYKEVELVRNIAEMAEVYYVRQKEALGLGHAVLCAKSWAKEDPFAVFLGDDKEAVHQPDDGDLRGEEVLRPGGDRRGQERDFEVWDHRGR